MRGYRLHSQRALTANQSGHKRSTGQSVTRLGPVGSSTRLRMHNDCLLNYQNPWSAHRDASILPTAGAGRALGHSERSPRPDPLSRQNAHPASAGQRLATRGKRARTRAGISRIPASSRRLRGARGGSGPRTRAFPGLATRNRLIASGAMSVVVLLHADSGSPTTAMLAAPEQSITRTQKSRRPTPALSELDEWQKRSRRPSALPFTDGQAQAARPHFTGIDAQAFTRRRRRRRRPPPSSRTDR
jgi:hypothetical protein